MDHTNNHFIKMATYIIIILNYSLYLFNITISTMEESYIVQYEVGNNIIIN